MVDISDTQVYKIKPVELETLTIDSQVISTFCSYSSPDDKLSIIVEGGVFIYELWPMPLCEDQTVTFLKFCISVSSMAPLGRLVADKSGFLWSLSRKEAFEAVLDSTMYSLLEKTESTNSTTQIIQCEFSPLICNQSYVSCLTNTGLLEIFKKEFKKWTSCVNVTQLWIEHCGFASSKKYTDFNEFKTKALAVKITGIKWYDKGDPVLVSLHRNGQICFWKVIPASNTISMSVSHCIEANISPCCLGLCSVQDVKCCILIIGSLSGCIKCVSINSDTLQINQELFLWSDEDSIIPSHIQVIQRAETILVLTVKRHILLFFSLKATANGVCLMKTNWLPFPSSISSLNECHGNFIIGLQNHSFYRVIIDNYDLQCQSELIDLEIKAKHRTSYHCYGLTLSKNKVMWIMVSSPKVAYDYLKGITDVTIYVNQVKTFKTLRDETCRGLIRQISNKFSATKLNDIADILELKRLELLSDDSKFSDSTDGYSKASTMLELKLMLWEVKLKHTSQTGVPECKISDLENLIMEKHAREIREKLREKIDVLSEIEEKSLMAISYFLSNEKEREGLVCDNCIVCGHETVFESVRISSCANSHKFPRCCISLLPCDRVPYGVCQNCDAVALTSFNKSGYCTLCDGVFLLNTRFQSNP